MSCNYYQGEANFPSNPKLKIIYGVGNAHSMTTHLKVYKCYSTTFLNWTPTFNIGVWLREDFRINTI